MKKIIIVCFGILLIGYSAVSISAPPAGPAPNPTVNCADLLRLINNTKHALEEISVRIVEADIQYKLDQQITISAKALLEEAMTTGDEELIKKCRDNVEQCTKNELQSLQVWLDLLFEEDKLESLLASYQKAYDEGGCK